MSSITGLSSLASILVVVAGGITAAVYLIATVRKVNLESLRASNSDLIQRVDFLEVEKTRLDAELVKLRAENTSLWARATGADAITELGRTLATQHAELLSQMGQIMRALNRDVGRDR